MTTSTLISTPEMLTHMINTTLLAHGVDARVAGYRAGPRVTTYDIALRPGVRLTALTRLRGELALALQAASLHLVPRAHDGVVGVEVPNAVQAPVTVMGVLRTAAYQAADATMALPAVLGVDSQGDPLVQDLAALPHLLVAGATGSGKSVALHGLITSLTWRRTPEQVQLILIDPKMVEFTPYETLPHLRRGIVTQAEDAITVLQDLEVEMERRYALLEQRGVRQLRELPAKERLPYIVVVLDELADLILTKPWGKVIETSLVRLAQKARAAGIHLVAATQRPQARVVTGLIKANFPSRLAFRVTTGVDSRVILDQGGAEHLLGAGDFLFQGPGMMAPVRGQGAYLSTAQIGAMTAKLATVHRSVRQDVPLFARLWRAIA